MLYSSHSSALNTVQRSQPSPGRSHFLSSEEGGGTGCLDAHEGIRTSSVPSQRQVRQMALQIGSSNTLNWHFERMNVFMRILCNLQRCGLVLISG